MTLSFKNGYIPSLCRFCNLLWRQNSLSVAKVQSRRNDSTGSGYLDSGANDLMLRGRLFHSAIGVSVPPVQPTAKFGSSFLPFAVSSLKCVAPLLSRLGQGSILPSMSHISLWEWRPGMQLCIPLDREARVKSGGPAAGQSSWES